MFALRITLLCVAVALSTQSMVQEGEDLATDPAATTPSITEHTFSILSSNAPDSQYDWDAIDCLSEAYTIHPLDIKEIVPAFTELYTHKHAGSWSANAGCKCFYSSKKSTIEIDIQVTESTGEITVVSIFN